MGLQWAFNEVPAAIFSIKLQKKLEKDTVESRLLSYIPHEVTLIKLIFSEEEQNIFLYLHYTPPVNNTYNILVVMACPPQTCLFSSTHE